MSGVTQESVPEGYKQTDVGLIPESWDVKYIGEFADVSSGGTPNRENKEYWRGQIPWITTTQIDGREILSAEQFITEQGLLGSASKWYPAGTLLMAMYGQGKTRGKVSLLGIDATINQACAGIRVKDCVETGFLLHHLKSRYTAIRNLSNAGSQENLSGGIIKSIVVPVPPKAEQTAIANALSDVDALITSLEKLIAKKRAMKTAAMQQLLTGKKRLPPFDQSHMGYKQTELGEIPEDWEVSSLGELCSLKSGETITAARLNDGSRYPCYGGNGIRGNTSSFTHDGEYVLIGRQGALCGNVQHVRGQFFASEHALVATVKKNANVKWLAIYLERMNLNQYSESSAQPGLSAVKLNVLKLIAPTEDEQTAIAKFLADMGAEIDSILLRLVKTQQLKQGMMQELLTGRTRLI